jgi:glycosyltransferase involved in cell wall biosynthesis
MEQVTFCIGTGINERPYLELLFHSMDKNFVRKDHEIIVFVDKEDNLNSIEFLLSQKKTFPNLKIIKNPLPIILGYQANMNYMFQIAKNDIVSCLHADMVVTPEYDSDIQKHLTPNRIVSSTRIEPPLHPADGEKIVKDFGTLPEHLLQNPDTFKSLCDFAKSVKDPNKLTPYFFAPFTLYKRNWNDIGGHDTQFRRAREDSDILWRFHLNKVEIIQSWLPMVYHFTCTASRGIKWWEGGEEQNRKNAIQQQADQIEIRKFIRKWGTFKHPVYPQEAEHYRYHIGANITNTSLEFEHSHTQIILQMFYLFNKVYVDNPKILDNVIDGFYAIQIPANTLYNYKREEWENNKHIFNVLEAKDIYTSTPINDQDVTIDIDIQEFLKNTEMQNAVSQMNDILHDSLSEGDTGDFEVNGLKVHVNKLRNRIFENIYTKRITTEGVNLIEL